ncbi:uncharacterized protein METZ01_LOCUS17135 [marine metagenome]|uniref:Phosphatidic acid phosphatase type 2/haloperoxidase domain-containing protein n=1 Tax=marine metagenome TaxID=408172 RepID=A0A381PBC5_9ZZZZ
MRNDWLDDMAIWFANPGLVWDFLSASVAVLIGLTLARRYADAAMLMRGLAVIETGDGLKVIVDRPRPDYVLLEPLPSNLSFPCGHSLLAVIVGGVLVYLVGLWVKPLLLRRSLQAGLVLVVIGMGASRVYLGPHWPSDVKRPLHVGSDGSNWPGGPSKRNRNRMLTRRGPNSPRATLELVVTSSKFEES